MSASPIIEARELEVGYGGEPLLAGVSFAVGAGEVFAIVGVSGSGKTTLVRALLGLLPASGGSLCVAGRELVGASADTRAAVLGDFGVAFQSGALFDSLTLAENVLVPIRARTTLPPATAATLARVTLATVGLAPAADLLPAQISGGMRKRAGIARAMALDPKILVLDEPTSGLDPRTAADLDRLIATLNRGLGITVVMVTHDLATTFALAHRCILVDAEARGILAEGPPAELRASHPNPKVRAFFERTA